MASNNNSICNNKNFRLAAAKHGARIAKHYESVADDCDDRNHSCEDHDWKPELIWLEIACPRETVTCGECDHTTAFDDANTAQVFAFELLVILLRYPRQRGNGKVVGDVVIERDRIAEEWRIFRAALW